jgi:hypothetical protein
MNSSRRFLFALSAAVAAAGFAVGTMTGLPGAHASATRIYTLRAGDKVKIPTIQQVCELSAEGGAPDLFCERPSGAHHQVTFFRDSILVWKVGNPDHAAWSGRP